jgi:hypothetical protein
VAWRELDKNQHFVLALGDRDSRRSVGVEKDVAVLQVLSIGAMLQMLLKGVAALDWRNRRFIDHGSPLVFVGHSANIRSLYGIARKIVRNCSRGVCPLFGLAPSHDECQLVTKPLLLLLKRRSPDSLTSFGGTTS